MIAPLLDAKQVAALLGVSVRTVQQLAASRQLPSVPVGRLVRFRPEDVEAFVASRRVSNIRPVRVQR